MKTSELKNLTVQEKLEAIELLWSSLQHEGAAIASPEWHENILQARRARIANGAAKFISVNELKTYYRAKS